jgi:hypothetical protein
MAYISMITEPRELTEAEGTQLANYTTAQTNAGTTNNAVYTWTVASIDGHAPDPDQIVNQNVRIWTTVESANGYKAIMAGFSPSIPVTVF